MRNVRVSEGDTVRQLAEEGEIVAWVNGLEDLHRELLVESPLFHQAVLMRSSAIEAATPPAPE